MNELKKSMRDKVTWMRVIVGTIIFIAFIIIVLPWISNYSAVSIGVSESPDMSIIYTSDDMYRIADLYGVEGRKTYIFLRWTFVHKWFPCNPLRHRAYPLHRYGLLCLPGKTIRHIDLLSSDVLLP